VGGAGKAEGGQRLGEKPGAVGGKWGGERIAPNSREG